MSKQINNSTPKTYDAGDLSDAYSLAECDMQWMSTAITHVKKEVKKLHEMAKNGEIISQYHFDGLLHHIDMYEYLADDRYNSHAKEAEAYKKEWEATK